MYGSINERDGERKLLTYGFEEKEVNDVEREMEDKGCCTNFTSLGHYWVDHGE